MKNSSINFSAEELQRYSRHFTLPQVGLEGQKRFKAAKVLCVGAGGLGSPLLLYLTAAGVGTLGIVDEDKVDLSNLQRQILYTTDDLQEKKVIAAKKRLGALNPHINLVLHETRLIQENALDIIAQYDIVVDGSDNFATRYLINDACFHLQKYNVFASISQFQGQCTIFTAPNGPCYRCLYNPLPAEPTPNCAEAGVLGVLPGILGSIQANEVIKLILNIGQPLIGRLLTIDALTLQFREFILERNPECPLCSQQKNFASLQHGYSYCSKQKTPTAALGINVQEFHALYEREQDLQVLDVREPYEYAMGHLDSILIPLAQLADRLIELDKNKLVVVYCKMGPRSEQAAMLLQNAGFTKVKYLIGGIQALQIQNQTSTDNV